MKSIIDASFILLFVLIWLGTVMFLRTKKKKSFTYLLFFTIFCVYVFKVLDYTLFRFQSLIVLKYSMPGLMLNGETAGESANLIPLLTLGFDDVKTSLLNILMTVPFGFGLPFVTELRMKQAVIAGMILSAAIESLQYLTGLMAGITFRVADINDVIFNTIGAAIGYVVFIAFLRLFRRLVTSGNPVLRYVAKRPQVPLTPDAKGL